MHTRRVLILDGFIDEPSTLGVPPTISPYVRYIFGAALDAFDRAGIPGEVDYHTITQYRSLTRHSGKNTKDRSSASSPHHLLSGFNIVILVNNTPVPGNYLSGRPASPRELQEIANVVVDGGGIVLSWKTPVSGARNLELDPDAFLYDLLTLTGTDDRLRTTDEWDRWSVLGAGIIRSHPDYPDRLISEIDTLKGCVRYINGGCVFCTDPLEHFRMRSPEAVLSEIRALVAAGGKHIRLGGSCILSFLSKGIGETDRPIPDSVRIGDLLKKIRSLLPEDGIFHTDNANAGIIAEYPEESRKVLEAIVTYTSSGNSLSLGLESADPVVGERNNLNAKPEEVAVAVRMINEIGRKRGENGMPRLLPGLNFLYGLPGERSETHEHNIQFLKELREEGQLFRRINVRQLSPVRISGNRKDPKFRKWKDQIRSTIDVPNLMDVIPVGTKLTGVHIETHDGGNSFGRQVGTYPILVGIPYPVELHQKVDVRIIDHGIRSVTGITFPMDLNTATIRELSSLPGVGRKRAARIIRNRPIQGKKELAEALEDERIASTVWDFSFE